MARISLFIGTIAPLPESGRPTGMFKHPVGTALQLGIEGFAGDQQADRRVHGGPEKAVHLYPAAHYARLAERFPEAADQLEPGSLGENISSHTLDETQVRIGDIFQLGEARLQLCQPRSPCWKIDDRFGVDGMAAFIAEQRLTGWYFRVLQPGTVTPDATLDLVEPAANASTLAAAMTLWQAHRPALEALRQLAATPGIASGWQRKIVDRLGWLEKQPPPAFHVKPEAP
ncbi:MAG TPA: MOSC domain-containing protein [Azonexus sp.]|nr:MOSC domain-containing protein [Azonexus sp.]